MAMGKEYTALGAEYSPVRELPQDLPMTAAPEYPAPAPEYPAYPAEYFDAAEKPAKKRPVRRKMVYLVACFGAVLMLSRTLAPAVGGYGGDLRFDSLGEEAMWMLMEAGVTQEEWDAMPYEQQEVILMELALASRPTQPTPSKPSQPPQSTRPTLADVDQGGRYVVTVGDHMWLNYFELTYVDGKLERVFVSFQKDASEEADTQLVEGEEVAQFGLFGVDFTAGPEAVVQALIDVYDGYYQLLGIEKQ